MFRSILTLLVVCASLTGCHGGAFHSSRVAHAMSQLQRPVSNPDDLLIHMFDLGYDHTHVLGVVGSGT